MAKILKDNYFIGVFHSMVSRSSLGGLVLFEPTKNKKHVKLVTNPGKDFNVYVKHSRRLKNATRTIAGKNKMSCNVDFLPSDYHYLLNEFPEEDKTNFVCLVCTNKELDETRLVLLKYEDAMKCLANKTAKGLGKINVTRTGQNHSYSCYGVGFKNEQPIKCPVDFRKYLGLQKNHCSSTG